MTNGFQSGYRVVGELPPGDALRAERAVSDAGAEVALKEVAPRDVARFLDEMAVVARVDDPHLESVVDSGRRGELPTSQPSSSTGWTWGRIVSSQRSAAGGDRRGLRGPGRLGAGGAASSGCRARRRQAVDDRRHPSRRPQARRHGVGARAGAARLSEEAPARAAWYVSPEEVMARPAGPGLRRVLARRRAVPARDRPPAVRRQERVQRGRGARGLARDRVRVWSIRSSRSRSRT